MKKATKRIWGYLKYGGIGLLIALWIVAAFVAVGAWGTEGEPGWTAAWAGITGAVIGVYYYWDEHGRFEA